MKQLYEEVTLPWQIYTQFYPQTKNAPPYAFHQQFQLFHPTRSPLHTDICQQFLTVSNANGSRQITVNEPFTHEHTNTHPRFQSISAAPVPQYRADLFVGDHLRRRSPRCAHTITAPPYDDRAYDSKSPWVREEQRAVRCCVVNSGRGFMNRWGRFEPYGGATHPYTHCNRCSQPPRNGIFSAPRARPIINREEITL